MTPTPNLTDLWWDSQGSVMTGTGYLSYNLILESSTPAIGSFQSSYVDDTVLPGDSYIEGTQSGTRATLSSFNNTQLIINSLTKAGFVYNEVFNNRRLYRPSFNDWTMKDHDDGASRLARIHRKSTAPYSSVDVSAWSFSQNEQALATVDKTDTTYSVSFASAHGFVIRQIIYISGTGIAEIDDRYFMVTDVPTPTTLEFEVVVSGTESAVIGTVKDGFTLINIETTTAHGFKVGDVVHPNNLDASGGFYPPNDVYRIVNIPDDTHLEFYSARLPIGTPTVLAGATVSLDNTIAHPYLPKSSIESWSNTTTTISMIIPYNSLVLGQKILVSGLELDGSELDAPNGMHTITGIGPDLGEVQFEVSVAPAGTAFTVADNATVRYQNAVYKQSVSGAIPDTYNLTNVDAFAVSDMEITYVLGPNTLPQPAPAAGAVVLDGIVAQGIVLNPIRVDNITSTGDGNIIITTYNDHGFVATPGPITFTVFGDPANSEYIRTYTGVSITVTSPTSFTLVGSSLLATSTYTNAGGSDDTFVKFADNPYSGPIQWDSDIIIKGIIGDKYFVIPQTAEAEGTSLANKFNINGLTGTAYLQDGQVAYIELERNEIVSNGAFFSTAGGGTVVTGSVVPSDINNQPLRSGDFIKWQNETESQWLRIKGTRGTPVVGNTFELETDRGRTPTIEQRAAAIGTLVYCKGTYDKIQVQPHWKVSNSADLYWLAVRRDNSGSNSKIYLKALELEAGEVRQINDNEVSNHLRYTGANTEAAVNPNYTVIDTTGSYQESEDIVINDIRPDIRMITVEESPALGFQMDDKITQGGQTWTIDFLLTSRTVILKESVVTLSAGAALYLRSNYRINDSDNLTLAIRKEDRKMAELNTAISRIVYDESAYVQKITVKIDHSAPLSNQYLKSGDYIYKGSRTNPDAMSWVLHGTEQVVENIEGADITMPGNHFSMIEGDMWNSVKTYVTGDIIKYDNVSYLALQTNTNVVPTASLGTDWNQLAFALIAHNSGVWLNNDAIYQLGDASGFNLYNPGNEDFPSPELFGGTSNDGVELALMPNRRTQVLGSEYVVFPSPLTYHASLDEVMTGDELMVIVNDSIRQAGVDYIETFGGPKGKIQLVRTTPPNTRIRARTMTAYGSALAAKPAGVDMQTAYNGGPIVVEIAGRPVDFRAGDANVGGSALDITGSIRIDGKYGTDVVGGLLGKEDKGFRIGREDNKPAEAWSAMDFVKTHDDHPASAWQRMTSSGISTNSSVTAIEGSKILVEEGTAVRVKVRATARRSDGTFGVAGLIMEGVYYREVGGDLLFAGSPITNIVGAEGDGLNYAMTFGITKSAPPLGPDDQIIVAVYGQGTVHWAFSIDFQRVGLEA